MNYNFREQAPLCDGRINSQPNYQIPTHMCICIKEL